MSEWSDKIKMTLAEWEGQPTGEARMLDLEPIKAREQAATEGPWEKRPVGGGLDFDVSSTIRGDLVGDYRGQFNREEDADFVAHARTDIPALIAEVERLRKMVSDIESGYYHLQGELKRFETCWICGEKKPLIEIQPVCHDCY